MYLVFLQAKEGKYISNASVIKRLAQKFWIGQATIPRYWLRNLLRSASAMLRLGKMHTQN